MLRITASVCAYSADQIGNGLSAGRARAAVAETVMELEHAASELRRLALARLAPAERRRLVLELARLGLSQRRIAAALGVSRATVQADLRCGSRLVGSQPLRSVARCPVVDTERDGAGNYELRDEVVRGVEVVAVYWVGKDRPPSRLLNLDQSRVPLLAQALRQYLASGPADTG